MNKNGFTMVELLATIVIIGILSTIGIVTVVNVRKNLEIKFDNNQLEVFRQTGKTYFMENRSKLPSRTGDENKVYLSELIENNYIDELLDYNKNPYVANESYLTVKKAGSNYIYIPYLVKEQDKGKKEDVIQKDDNPTLIKFVKYQKQNKDSIGCMMTDKTKKKNCDNIVENVSIYYANATTVVDIEAKDIDKILLYQYSIEHNENKIYTSEYIAVDKQEEISDKLKLDLKNYQDGKYKFKVTVYDSLGNIKTLASKDIVIDTKKPVCDSKKNPSDEWSNKNVEILGLCSDNKGKYNSGCVSQSVKKNFSDEMNVVKSPGIVEDYAGNKTSCDNVEIKIDKTSPKCGTVSGESTTWIKGTRVISATCSDEESGCKNNIYSKTYGIGSNLLTVKSTEFNYTVEDKAGNKKECKSNVNVYVDNTGPMCSISGENTSWTKNNVNLTVNCIEDANSQSGCRSGSIPISYDQTARQATVNYTISDNVGNETNCSRNVDLYIDKTAPSCVSSGGSGDKWTNQDVIIKGTCSDNDSGCETETITKTISEEAENYFGPGEVCDNVGNCAICPKNQLVKIDKTPPTCLMYAKYENTNTYYTSGAFTANTVLVSYSCNDNRSGCDPNYRQLFTDGAVGKRNYPNYNQLYSRISENGESKVNFKVRDNAGNISDYCSYPAFIVKKDTLKPTVKSCTYNTGNNKLYVTIRDQGLSGLIQADNTTYASERSYVYSLDWVDTDRTNAIIYYGDRVGNKMSVTYAIEKNTNTVSNKTQTTSCIWTTAQDCMSRGWSQKGTSGSNMYCCHNVNKTNSSIITKTAVYYAIDGTGRTACTIR